MSMSDYIFSKPQFCDVSQRTILYVMSSMVLSLADGGKLSFIPNVKKSDYVEYFLIDLLYEIIAKNTPIMSKLQILNNPYSNMSLTHVGYMVAVKSLFDKLALGRSKFLDNLISISVAEGANISVDYLRSKM